MLPVGSGFNLKCNDMSSETTENDDLTDDLFERKTILVDPGQKPLRIDKFLMDRLEKVSRNQVQNAIRAGAVLVDDQEIKPNFKVKPAQLISILLPPSSRTGEGVVPENIPLDIRYEDDDLMVIHKPAGLVVHPGVGNWTGTLVNALAYHYQEQELPVLHGNQNDRLGLVHRIDKDTSGLLVIAKSDYAMSHLAKQFFNHTVERTYIALIWGEPEEED